MNLMNGIKWSALSQLSKIFSQLISMIILARLIPPSEFGIMSIAMVVVTFSSLFRDLGTSSAVIQRKTLNQELLSAILGLNIISASIITFLIVCLSPFIAVFFEQSQLFSVLVILSISFPIMSLGSVHLALFERESKFKFVALVEISASILSLVIAIITAYLGWGVYSLVVLNISSSLISTILLWIISDWRPLILHLFNLTEIKKIFSFSGHLTLFNFINYFSRNADNIIIGKVLGSSILGAYSLAYKIMLFPLQSMTFVVSRTLYPIMSRNQDNNEDLYNLYINVVNVIFFLVCPLMLGLAILREPFIESIFGLKWGLTADILLWLAPTGVIQAVVSTTGVVFMTKGKTNILFLLGILGMFLQVTAFICGVKYDVVTLAKFYFISNLLNAILPLVIVVKLLNGKMRAFLLSFLPSIIINLITFLGLYLLLEFGFLIQTDNQVLNLIMIIVMTVLFYLGISFPIVKKYIVGLK